MVSIQLSADSSDETKGKFINELVAECKKILKSNPNNRCAKYCSGKLWFETILSSTYPKQCNPNPFPSLCIMTTHVEFLESEEGKKLDAKDLLAFW